MDPVWRAELFGGLKATLDGFEISRFESQQTACLFAYLALNRSRNLSKELLVELLWPESDPSVARRRLNQALYSLRRQFETASLPGSKMFVSEWNSIRLDGDCTMTDVSEFEDAIAVLRIRVADDVRLEKLNRATDLYKGEFLAELSGDWIEPIRQRYSDMYRKALEWQCRLLEQTGDLDAALQVAERLVEAEPLEEENYITLIRLHGLLGQTAAAQRQFRRLEEVLFLELGEIPSTASRNLIESIRGRSILEGSGPAIQFKAERLRGRPRIPDPMTRFFGRKAEQSRVSEMIADSQIRLLTLVGAGGCGKTRLAIEIARALNSGFKENVWFVSLAELSVADQIPEAILSALEDEFLGATPLQDQLVTSLKARGPALLVLDNFEHLLEDGAVIVQDLLQRLPTLQVLITSRQRLNLAGEQLCQVEPLPVPPESSPLDDLLASPSAQLYVDRARSAMPSFEVTTQNAEVLREICERLDGIPLALELSAAWSSSMSLSEVQRGLRQRFELLVSRRRDISDRHRSMRAAIEYGFDNLPQELQAIFLRLSVFQDGWTAQSAAYVSEQSDLREALSQLAERSLIRVDVKPQSIAGRYAMFETLREYGWERLTQEERANARLRLAEYYAGLQQSPTDLAGLHDSEWIELIDAERRNMVFALGWCLETKNAALGLPIAIRLRSYWETRGPISEGRGWLERLLCLADNAVSPVVRAHALSALGRLDWSLGDYRAAREAHEDGLSIYEQLQDHSGIAKSHYNLGIVAYRLGDNERAQEHIERSLSVAREIGDDIGIARALLILGNLAIHAVKYADAKRYFDESYFLEKRLGNHVRAASALNNLGDLAYHEKKYVLAGRYFEECVSEFRRYGNKTSLGLSLANLAILLGRQGHIPAGVEISIECTQICRSTGFRPNLRTCLYGMALLAAWSGDAEAAATVFGLVERISIQMQVPAVGKDDIDLDEAIELCRQALGPEGFESAHTYGASMTDERGVDYALQWAETFLRHDHTPKDSAS